MTLHPGDLVREATPLMAGDAPERLGLILQVKLDGHCKVLFDKEELVHYKSLRRVEK